MDAEEAWQLIKNYFPILQDPPMKVHKDISQDSLAHISDIVTKLGVHHLVQAMVINKIEKHMREMVVPTFWSYFVKIDDKYGGFLKFCKAIEFLYTCSSKYTQVVLQLQALQKDNTFCLYGDTDAIEAMKLIVRATLLSQLPTDHANIIEDFYDSGLKMEDTDSYFQDNVCTLCHQQRAECKCMQTFHETNRSLVILGLLEPLVGQILTNLVYVHVENHIQKVCKENFDTSFIKSLEEWLESSIISWLAKVHFLQLSNSNDNTMQYMCSFKQKLTNFLYETYTKTRIGQFFNIIIEYPDSLPALEDLRKCLAKTDLRPLLTRKLQRAMETRLLHPGVSTPDILTAYIASIRSMRVLDPSGSLLEIVTLPIHRYLRSREDTVRCVVSSLTEEGPNELAEELVKGDAVYLYENNLSDEESENWENWVPDPVDVYPHKSSNARRSSDIISMLVNVYGSKELFVNEYRTLLADRLLSQFTCDTVKEIRYLELLKLRFGDSQLHYCEVMLKDVADSKRINQHIKQDPSYKEEGFPMSAMIVSAQFWPPFKDEKLELHSKVLEKFEIYTQSFQMLKGNRTLSWKNHLGVVNIEIETRDRTLNLSVSPIHATILMHFQEKNEWDLDDLSRVIHIPPTMLRRKMGFWQSHGLIEETRLNIFHLVETENSLPNTSTEVVEEYESESAMASTQDQREEELQTFWSYIIGMLMNLDSLPLERIHQMLKMFAFQGPTIECSLQELRHFLDRKVREHQLVYSGGVYKLPKSDSA